ncbi:MAG: amino acid dehydrogenase [Chlamydiota bacterium]
MVDIPAAGNGQVTKRFPKLKIKIIEVEGFESVVEGIDTETNMHCYIAVHSTKLGPALGGTRIYPYKNPEDALDDVIRLAEAMTSKSAIAEVGLGGGKSVIIADPKKQKNSALLHSFAEVINYFQGNYISAEDIGTTTQDMAVMREVTPYISCLATKQSSGDPSRFTAWGIFRGIQATLNNLYGSNSVKGKTVAIQGLGHVGSKLADYLFWHGANLIVTDVDQKKLDHVKHTYSAKVVPPNEIFGVDCDIFAPCAMGGVINPETISHFRCKGIAGGANNQLSSHADGQLIFEKEILYAPDFIINSGGLINAAMEFEADGYDPIQSRNKTDHIYNILTNIFDMSEREFKPTSLVADEIAEHNLKEKIGKRIEPIDFGH